MVSKKTSDSRVFQMLFDAVERRGDTLDIVARECEIGSTSILVQCWKGILIIPVSFVPGIARYLGVDPAWLLRIYLEDHLPDTMKMIEQCELAILLTERERELVFAYRRATADQDPPMTVTIDGQLSFEVRKEGVPPSGG